jgi:hypothetical protein
MPDELGAVEHDRPLVRLVEAADAVEQRRLAGAVRADQGTDLALTDVEGGAVERRDPSESQGNVPDGEDGPVGSLAG